MGRKRSRHSATALRFWTALGVGVLAVVTAGLVVAALQSDPRVADRPAYVPAPMPTQAEEIRAAFIGDSYTAGAGSTSGGFAYLVASAKGWTFVNLGRGGTGFLTTSVQDPKNAQNACGQDYCESYPEMIPAAVAANADTVIVSGGRNNVTANPAGLEAGIRQFYSDLRAALPNARIIATSPLWDDEAPPAFLAEIGGWVQSAVIDVSGTYLDIGQPLEGHPEMLADDGIHPNDVGHRAIADAIIAELNG